MSNEKDFQQRVQRIGALVQEIESIADPAVRASTTQLVQLIMEFHGTGLDRTLEILANAGGAGNGNHRSIGTRSDGEQPAGSLRASSRQLGDANY